MSHFGHENHDRQTDEYGNPIHHTAGGNTGAHVTHAGGEYGTGAYGTQTGGEYGTGGNTGGAYGTQSGGDQYGTGTLGHEFEKKGHGQGGILHRSKSSSSSSSEDDGEGGRRKKSIKEKIKEKLPGGNKPKTEGQDAYAHGHGATTTHQEGHGHDSGYRGATTTHETYGAHRTDEQPETKGFMEKIKEKLPGHHNAEGN